MPLVIFLWTVTLVLVFTLNFYFSNKQQTLEIELNQVDQIKHQKMALLEALQTELANLKIDPELHSQVAKKQQVTNLKKRVYHELMGQEKGKTSGYAKLMLDLAEYHQADIWLTRIYLNEQNVTIEGAASKTESIPNWINNLLNQSSYFKGQNFSDTHIYRNEEQQLRFVLAAGENITTTQGDSNE
ncbi:PilN domain-containing protein [Paraglaciecola sp.]|uniref:PilN domain-containing protein n=1 Tax=Paraglaciecola sp. TaxID=1920173 RepID=UPI003EF167DD